MFSSLWSQTNLAMHAPFLAQSYSFTLQDTFSPTCPRHNLSWLTEGDSIASSPVTFKYIYSNLFYLICTVLEVSETFWRETQMAAIGTHVTPSFELGGRTDTTKAGWWLFPAFSCPGSCKLLQTRVKILPRLKDLVQTGWDTFSPIPKPQSYTAYNTTTLGQAWNKVLTSTPVKADCPRVTDRQTTYKHKIELNCWQALLFQSNACGK